MNAQRVYAGVILILITLATACSAGPEQATIIVPPTTVSATAVEESRPTPPVTEAPTISSEDERFARLREQMVQEGVINWGIEDEAVIAAMRTVPRHAFVPVEFLNQAYENHPLPIGHSQTISQPYIVALMTEAAAVSPTSRVLEIGTGSGYQAAVLAELVDHVYTIEIIGALADQAQETLNRLGYKNVTVRHADGYFGWEEYAPYDAIIVTAAPDHIPHPLVQQLKIGGRMIIPVGPVGGFQTLWLVTRVGEDEVRTENLGGVRFVPLTREEQ